MAARFASLHQQSAIAGVSIVKPHGPAPVPTPQRFRFLIGLTMWELYLENGIGSVRQRHRIDDGNVRLLEWWSEMQ